MPLNPHNFLLSSSLSLSLSLSTPQGPVEPVDMSAQAAAAGPWDVNVRACVYNLVQTRPVQFWLNLLIKKFNLYVEFDIRD